MKVEKGYDNIQNFDLHSIENLFLPFNTHY
jgi:hypothetical protein